jgi:hypothetical protein
MPMPLLEAHSFPSPPIQPRPSSKRWWPIRAGGGMQATKRHAFHEGGGHAYHKNRPINEKTRWSYHWEISYEKHHQGYGLTHDVWSMWWSWPLWEWLPWDPWRSFIYQQRVSPTE